MFFKYIFFIVMIICVTETYNLGILENSNLRKFLSKEGQKYNGTTAITYPCFTDSEINNSSTNSTNKSYNVIEILQNLVSNETESESKKSLDDKFYDVIVPVKKYFEKKEVKLKSKQRYKSNFTENDEDHNTRTTADNTYEYDENDNTDDLDHNYLHNYDEDLHVQHDLTTTTIIPKQEDVTQDYFDELHDNIHVSYPRKKKQKVKGLKSLFYQGYDNSALISRMEYPGISPANRRYDGDIVVSANEYPNDRPCSCAPNNNHNCGSSSQDCIHSTSEDTAATEAPTPSECSRTFLPPTCSRGASHEGSYLTTPYTNSSIPVYNAMPRYFNSISTYGFLNISGYPSGVPYYTMKMKDLKTLTYWMFNTPNPQNVGNSVSYYPYYTLAPNFYNRPVMNTPDWRGNWKTMTTCFPLYFYPTTTESGNRIEEIEDDYGETPNHRPRILSKDNLLSKEKSIKLMSGGPPTEKPCPVFLAEDDINNDTLLEFDSRESVNAMVEDILSLESDEDVGLKKCYCRSFASKYRSAMYSTVFLILIWILF